MSLLMMSDLSPATFLDWADINDVEAQIAVWVLDVTYQAIVVRIPEEREVEVRLVWADHIVDYAPLTQAA